MTWKILVVTIVIGIPASVMLVLLFAWAFVEASPILSIARSTPQSSQSAVAELSTGAAAAATLFAYVLVVVTVIYVRLTNQISRAANTSALTSKQMVEEAKASSQSSLEMARKAAESVDASRQMVDQMSRSVQVSQEMLNASVRALLVPVANLSRPLLYIQPLSKFTGAPSVTGVAGSELLSVRNVGLGPALNVAVGIESSVTSCSIPLDRAGTKLFVMKDDTVIVYQWASVEAIPILTGSKLTMLYDDALGNHWTTTAVRRESEWIELITESSTQAPPRRVYDQIM